VFGAQEGALRAGGLLLPREAESRTRGGIDAASSRASKAERQATFRREAEPVVRQWFGIGNEIISSLSGKNLLTHYKGPQGSTLAKIFATGRIPNSPSTTPRPGPLAAIPRIAGSIAPAVGAPQAWLARAALQA
jgi:hypothetical protein